MIVIETCPLCGGDLIHSYLASYPPVEYKRCTSCGWSWYGDEVDIVRVPFRGNRAPQPIPNKTFVQTTGSACEHCSNNPKNGGSGVCHCTLGLQPIVC